MVAGALSACAPVRSGDPALRFTARDGRAMVMVPADIYDRLRTLAAQALEARPPADVAAAIAGGAHPIAAWRRHRGLSQHALAALAGVSRVWIGRIEQGAAHGTPATRAKLAAALEVGVGVLAVIDPSPRT